MLRDGGSRGSELRLLVSAAAATVKELRPIAAGTSVDFQPARPSVASPTSRVERDESLWRDHRERLFRFVVRRVEDEHAAEDIVHDVLVRAYSRKDSLRDEQKLERWMYQITRNAVIDHYRARKPTAPLPPDLPAPDEATSGNARRELAQCLGPFIESLPDPYKDAVVLSEIEGLTQQETARRLGISLSGAKSRVQRARRMLEARVLDCCRLEFDSRGALTDYEERGTGQEAPPPACGDC